MKITYKHNPLATTVELDERDRALMRARLYSREMEEIIFHSKMKLAPYQQPEGFQPDVAGAVKELEEYFELDENSEHITKQLEYFEAELQSTHVGDCTCFPATCCKCLAEDMVGIDTLKLDGKYIGKHEGAKCFGLWKNNPDLTLNEAIAKLDDYAPKFEDHPNWSDEESFIRCIPRWTQEAKNLRAWLINYRNTHFGEQA